MNILSYYLKQQENSSWKDKFQSTGEDKSGKLYPFTNTNYRNINSFLTHMEEFKKINGLDRKNWGKSLNTGQDMDKQRIVNLRRAKFIDYIDETTYQITPFGWTCLSISEQSQSGNISEKKGLTKDEQRILLYLLLLNYGVDKKKDIIVYSKKYFNSLKKVLNINDSEILIKLGNFVVNNCKNKKSLFTSDFFWYISFLNDDKFPEIYRDSSYSEKKELYEFVLSKKNEKNDCIAHKYVTGGAFSVTSFQNEAKILYITNELICSKQSFNFEEFIKFVLETYNSIFPINIDNTLKFINSNKKVYENIFISISEFLG